MYLRPGDYVEGAAPGEALCVEADEAGAPVVKITVAGAHTCCAEGLLSHNMKPLNP